MQSRRSAWWRADAVQVHYDPGSSTGAAGDLLVGMGLPPEPGAPAYVALNHKKLPPGQRTRSVTDLVATAAPSVVAGWRACFPRGIADVRRIVVEDASLDTCMALLLFARTISPDPSVQAAALGAVQLRFAGDGAARETAWRAYVADWEEGRYTDGPDLHRSVACLISVLAHSLLPGSGPDGPAPPDDTHAREALVICLSLLDACIDANDMPCNARPPVREPAHALADAQLEFERQQYLLVKKHGVKLQLSVPLAGTRRRVVVDALLFDDAELTGVLKVLARTDVDSSWTHRGFALLGVHRPALAHRGDHMTVSVDPDTGLTLEALWDRLEALENERWGDARPNKASRPGIAKYSDRATGKPIAGAPDQPWWDDHGRYTLVGAPRVVEATGEVGTRLGWAADVVPLLWQLYCPFPTLTARLVETNAVGRIVTVRWRDTGAAPAPLAAGRMPVLHRWLASCHSPHGTDNPVHFVPHDDLQIVELAGGDIVAHPKGVALFDDWTTSVLDVEALADVACRMAGLTAEYRTLLDSAELDELRSLQRDAIERLEHIGYRRYYQLRQRLLVLKTRLTDLASREAMLPPVPGAAELRAAVEKAWGLPQTRHELRETVQRIDDALADAHALMQERRQFRTTAVLGATAVFFVLRDALAVIQGKLTLNAFETALPLLEKMQVDVAAAKDLPPTARDSLLARLANWHAEMLASARTASLFDDANLLLLVATVVVCVLLGLTRYAGVGAAPPRARRARHGAARPAAPTRGDDSGAGRG